MIYFIIIGLAILSIVMALWSLQKQKKLDELKVVKKELKKGRVIFNHSSSVSD